MLEGRGDPKFWVPWFFWVVLEKINIGYLRYCISHYVCLSVNFCRQMPLNGYSYSPETLNRERNLRITQFLTENHLKPNLQTSMTLGFYVACMPPHPQLSVGFSGTPNNGTPLW